MNSAMSELLKETHRRSGRFVFDTTSGRRRLFIGSLSNHDDDAGYDAK